MSKRSIKNWKHWRLENWKQWRLESAERRKHLGELEKQAEAIKASKTILDLSVIQKY